MNNPEVLFWFLIGSIAVAAGTVLASFLQLRQIEVDARAKKILPTLQGASQPLVTVLLYSRNRAKSLEKAFAAVVKSEYEHFDVVLIDDASTDETPVILQRLTRKRYHVPVTSLRRRVHANYTDTLRAGYAKSKKGALVIVVTPDITITPDAIKWAVARQQGRKVWRSVSNEPLESTVTLLGVARALDTTLWHQAPALQCAEKTWLHLLSPEPLIALPATRAIVGSIVFGGLVLAVLTAWGAEALWYVWIVLTFYGVTAVWLHQGVPFRDRIIMSYAAPSLLFLLPAMYVVRGSFQLVSRK